MGIYKLVEVDEVPTRNRRGGAVAETVEEFMASGSAFARCDVGELRKAKSLVTTVYAYAKRNGLPVRTCRRGTTVYFMRG